MGRSRGTIKPDSAADPVSEFMDLVDPQREFTQLILSRRIDQSVVVTDIATGKPLAVISINAIDGSDYGVSVGCHAPLNVSIDRDSVYLSKLLDGTVGRDGKGPIPTKQQEGEINKWLSQHQPSSQR